MILGYLSILALVGYYAYRYSKTTIDPDWAMFNMGGFTNAIYGRDFVDCKTPLIHLWYAGIAAIVGKSVSRVRFTHHTLVSLPSLALYWYTGSVWIALAFVAMVNSGWLFAFHGNVGQIPAGMIAIALISNDSTAALALMIAIAFEPKLTPSVIVMAAIGGYIVPLAWMLTACGLVAVMLWKYAPEYWDMLVYQNITIPGRMTKNRYKFIRNNKPNMFNFSSANALLYVTPWVVAAVWQKPVIEYWLPAIIFLLITAMGAVLRQNHLLPLVGWLFAAGVPDAYWIAFLIVELVSAGFYLSDVWMMFYPGLRNDNIEAKGIGKFLKGKAGDLWVNGYHSAVYVYAEKAPVGGLCEQFEINDTATERREEWRKHMKEQPPKYVVEMGKPGWKFDPRGGYRKIAHTEAGSKIYERVS